MSSAKYFARIHTYVWVRVCVCVWLGVPMKSQLTTVFSISYNFKYLIYVIEKSFSMPHWKHTHTNTNTHRNTLTHFNTLDENVKVNGTRIIIIIIIIINNNITYIAANFMRWKTFSAWSEMSLWYTHIIITHTHSHAYG